MTRSLALFDFDGTITSKDTMLEFIRFVRSPGRLLLSYFILSPYLLMMKLGLLSRAKAKEKLLKFHFGGMTQEDLQEAAESFCDKVLPNILRDKALSQLQHHRMQGHEVFIISASLDIWLKPWLDYQKFTYATTEGEFEDGIFTGRLASPNLYGEEKVRLIRERYNLSDFDTIYAYGDTAGDKPMMELATIKRYKPFRRALSTHDKEL